MYLYIDLYSLSLSPVTQYSTIVKIKGVSEYNFRVGDHGAFTDINLNHRNLSNNSFYFDNPTHE